MSVAVGIPPAPIRRLLQLEGLAALVIAATAYQVLGGNWWIFALLLLAPDLSFVAYAAGEKAGTLAYNTVHTYAVPGLLGLAGWITGTALLIQLALIWVAHIGMDRTLGYGLKYPGLSGHTHIGLMGKARKNSEVADPR